MENQQPTNIWTIGHSTLTSEEFIKLLSSNEIGVLADVRRFPASRKYPQFNRDDLSRQLRAAGIEYVHLPELGAGLCLSLWVLGLQWPPVIRRPLLRRARQKIEKGEVCNPQQFLSLL